MVCAEARKLLPGLALGDLDAEPARALQAHLEACTGCRAEQASLAAAVSALRASAPLAGSTERREAAASAMAGAHAEEVERRLFLRKRRPWGRWAAALLGIAAAGALAVLRPGAGAEVDLRAAEVRGRADVFRAEEGRWSPLSAGGRVLPGDRVITQPGSRVRLDVLWSRVGRILGHLLMDGDASIARIDGSRIALDRGRLFLELREACPGPVVVSDTANNRVSLQRGRLELGLREVRAVVAGEVVSREGRSGAVAAEARADVARRLAARVAEGEAALRGSHDQTLFAGAGQEGSFDLGGKPETKEAAVPAGPQWWD